MERKGFATAPRHRVSHVPPCPRVRLPARLRARAPCLRARSARARIESRFASRELARPGGASPRVGSPGRLAASPRSFRRAA